MTVNFEPERLYAGFVNSFNGLMLMAGNWAKGRADPAQSTHGIIDWFRRTGVAYGYYPVCERNRRDLEWFDVKDDRPVLHLESENFWSKADHTLDKLIESDAAVRVGLLWTNKSAKKVEAMLRRAQEATEEQDWSILLIVRRAVKEPRAETHRHGEVYHYPLEGHVFASGKHEKLWPAYLEWPASWGLIIARWEPKKG